MTKNQNSTQYDLEERTFKFARRAVSFCKGLPKTVIEGEISKQLVRTATSVGANYIEANEALGKKAFIMRIKICRKEAKESRYWLILIDTEGDRVAESERQDLEREATELTSIFSSILLKSK